MQRNPKESNLTGLSEEDHKLLADTAGLSGSLLNPNLSSTSQSDPVWPMLLMMLIAFMSFELILSGMISRERFGTAAISETSERIGDASFGMPVEFGKKAASREPQGASRG